MVQVHVLDSAYLKKKYSISSPQKPTGLLTKLALDQDMSIALIEGLPKGHFDTRDVDVALEIYGELENVFFTDMSEIDEGRLYCAFKKK